MNTTPTNQPSYCRPFAFQVVISMTSVAWLQSKHYWTMQTKCVCVCVILQMQETILTWSSRLWSFMHRLGIFTLYSGLCFKFHKLFKLPIIIVTSSHLADTFTQRDKWDVNSQLLVIRTFATRLWCTPIYCTILICSIRVTFTRKWYVDGFRFCTGNTVVFDGVLLKCFLMLQVLKRKPDLYRSEGLDIRVVFYCGESPSSTFIIEHQVSDKENLHRELFLLPSSGILAFKFPETPTLKSTCVLFVSHSLAIPLLHQNSVLYRRNPLLQSIIYYLLFYLLFAFYNFNLWHETNYKSWANCEPHPIIWHEPFFFFSSKLCGTLRPQYTIFDNKNFFLMFYLVSLSFMVVFSFLSAVLKMCVYSYYVFLGVGMNEITGAFLLFSCTWRCSDRADGSLRGRPRCPRCAAGGRPAASSDPTGGQARHST